MSVRLISEEVEASKVANFSTNERTLGKCEGWSAHREIEIFLLAMITLQVTRSHNFAFLMLKNI